MSQALGQPQGYIHGKEVWILPLCPLRPTYLEGEINRQLSKNRGWERTEAEARQPLGPPSLNCPWGFSTSSQEEPLCKPICKGVIGARRT